MPEHYTRNTTGILKHCPTCNKMTIHKVSNKRLGTCTEPHAVGRSEKQKKQDEITTAEPTLF
jgi:ribosomal protein L44E